MKAQTIYPTHITYPTGKVYIKCINPENPREWSIYRITIDDKAWQGEGLDDIFLQETTGYEQSEDLNKINY